MKKMKERKTHGTTLTINNTSVHVKNTGKEVPESKAYIPVTRNRSKRIVRTKIALKETKHTLKKVSEITKIAGRKRKRQKLETLENEGDPQEDKENYTPTPATKKANSKNRSGSRHKKRNIKNSYEKSIKKEISDEEVSGTKSTKRLSLKKKPTVGKVESASKISVSGSIKESSE